jgi:hypothetical protein
MFVEELFESMANTALDQLLYNVNKMSVLYLDTLPSMIKNLYAEGNHDDMYRTAKTLVGRFKGRWFAENYLSTSSRRDSPTAGMKNALVALSKDNTFKSNHKDLQHLGSLAIYASGEQREEHKASFGSHVSALEGLPKLLDSMIPNAPIDVRQKIKQTALKLRHAIDSFYALWDRLHQQWSKEWGPQSGGVDQKPKPVLNNNGQQSAQANNMVDQVLNSLDKKTAHEIRLAIARSDNKLIALQQELNRRNIQL